MVRIEYSIYFTFMSRKLVRDNIITLTMFSKKCFTSKRKGKGLLIPQNLNEWFANMNIQTKISFFIVFEAANFNLKSILTEIKSLKDLYTAFTDIMQGIPDWLKDSVQVNQAMSYNVCLMACHQS